MAAVGCVSLKGCAVERGNAPLHECEWVQQGWMRLRCSRGCCRSTATLETCQRRRSLRVLVDDEDLEPRAGPRQAVHTLISYRSLRDAAPGAERVAGEGGCTFSQSGSMVSYVPEIRRHAPGNPIVYRGLSCAVVRETRRVFEAWMGDGRGSSGANS
jgi:hypothetical protein